MLLPGNLAIKAVPTEEDIKTYEQIEVAVEEVALTCETCRRHGVTDQDGYATADVIDEQDTSDFTNNSNDRIVGLEQQSLRSCKAKGCENLAVKTQLWEDSLPTSTHGL